MWGTWLRRAAVLLAIVAGSQLGHAIVYSARYGAGAGRLESAGVHGYFPTLTAGLGAVLGVAVMSALLIVAAARWASSTPAGFRPRGTVRFLDVLALAFIAQLLLFVGQETLEALAAGHAATPLSEQVLWGAFGQLPAAALAAAAITWLLTRLEAAWTVVANGLSRLPVDPPAPAVVRPARAARDGRPRLDSTFPAAFRRRGPPSGLVLN
ncbi:MAG: hypothetical protein E6J41_00805 [Chloroflexi bacterium]|nr:MAG: hypothetical protein E6J41_00805 [Chloroflexota bacterium]